MLQQLSSEPVCTAQEQHHSMSESAPAALASLSCGPAQSGALSHIHRLVGGETGSQKMIQSPLSSEWGQPEQGAQGCLWLSFRHLHRWGNLLLPGSLSSNL